MQELFRRLIEMLWKPVKYAPPVDDERTIIDQAAYYAELERRQKRWQEDQAAIQRDRAITAYLVWEWARDTVRDRYKKPLPSKLPRDPVLRSWLNGLWVQEIFALARSDALLIEYHIYNADVKLDDVREVQMLPPSDLPKVSIRKDDVGAVSAGGGPKRRWG